MDRLFKPREVELVKTTTKFESFILSQSPVPVTHQLELVAHGVPDLAIQLEGPLWGDIIPSPFGTNPDLGSREALLLISDNLFNQALGIGSPIEAAATG